MRMQLVYALVMAISPMAVIAEPDSTQAVSVTQLEQEIAGHKGGWDSSAAHSLADLRLAERLTGARMAALLQKLGKSSARDALTAIADESEFSGLPPEQSVVHPAPNADDEKQTLELAKAYVKNTAARWPSFTAMRSTTRFEGTATVIPPGLQDDLDAHRGRKWLRSPVSVDWECPRGGRMEHVRLTAIEKRNVAVIYRSGHEVHTVAEHGGEFACIRDGVSTWDEFGEPEFFLELMTSIGHLRWTRWEPGPVHDVAVFHGKVALYDERTPHSTIAPPRVDLEGDIAIDPADGTVLRLTMTRRWKEGAFEKEYDTLMDYGPVSMGGTTYFLPIHRVAIFRTPILRERDANKESAKEYKHFHLQESPLQEYLNDVRFSEYQPEIRHVPLPEDMQASAGSR